MRILIILGATFFLLSLAVLFLSIGRLISGKNRLRKGCGMKPDEKGKCRLCGTEKKCEKDEPDDSC